MARFGGMQTSPVSPAVPGVADYRTRTPQRFRKNILCSTPLGPTETPNGSTIMTGAMTTTYASGVKDGNKARKPLAEKAANERADSNQPAVDPSFRRYAGQSLDLLQGHGLSPY